MKLPCTILCALLAAAASLTADVNWVRTARVFLIDAYQPPFIPRLEFDADALARTMSQMHANTVRIATMGAYALIPHVRFTPHPELGNRDILAETIAASKPRGIRVVPYISTGHRLAWSMVTRDHPEYAQHTRPGGGPARSRMYGGADYGTVCWNTPYRQAFLDLVERVVRDYDIDGIYFDRWRAGYFWPGRGVCYCDGCRTGFRKATGLELPWHERDEDYTPQEIETIDRYHRWYQDRIADIARQVRRLVKSYKDIPLIYNINNPELMAREDPRIIEAMDAFLYERGNSILERAEGVSLARASGLDVWPYVGEYNNWPRTIDNASDFQQQIFTTAMFGGAPILALPWGYVQHAAYRGFVERPFGVLEAHERELAGLRNYPYAAVVYEDHTPPDYGEPPGWWWKTDVRTSSLGAFAACLYAHVQVSSIHESLLDNLDALRAYRVLYLAGVTHLSQRRIANIERFVETGGGLVVSYKASLFDSEGRPAARFALEDLVRVRPVKPAGQLAGTIAEYHSMTGGPYDLYLADRAHPSPGTLTPLWSFQPIAVLEGGEVWKDIVTGDGLRPILPGVVVSSHGKGRVVYSASALESLFLQRNSRLVGQLLTGLIARAASEPPPYEIDGPQDLITNLAAGPDVLVLHLTNWTGNKLERAGANEYYVAPVENVRVRLTVPSGRRVRKVTLLVDAPFRHERHGSTLEVSIPRIEAYQAVRVELE